MILEAAKMIDTLWPNGNESRIDIRNYSFVIDKLFALMWASYVDLCGPPVVNNKSL